ncbi:hypothetical protein Tco_0597344 [Tanacetum coccineum]
MERGMTFMSEPWSIKASVCFNSPTLHGISKFPPNVLLFGIFFLRIASCMGPLVVREFLKKSKHLCHSVVNLFSLFEDSGFVDGRSRKLLQHMLGVGVELVLGDGCGPLSRKSIWSSSSRTFMVVKSEVLNVFPRLFGVLIVELATGSAVNFTLKIKGDMVVKKFDLKPTIDAMMRDFLEQSFPVERIEQGKSSKILPCGDGSFWKPFKPISSLIEKGKLK